MNHNSIRVLAAALLFAAPTFAQDKQDKKDDKPVVQAPKSESYKLGSTVDEKLELTDLDGKKLTFKELRGKVVVVHFWSMVCPVEPQAEIKFKAMAEQYKAKNVVLVAVASNQNEIGKPPAADAKRSECYTDIREHLKTEKIAYPIWVDHGNKISELFKGRTTPHCFVIDPKGTIVYSGALDDDPRGSKGAETKSYVRDAIDLVLAGKDVLVKETKPYG